MKISGNIIAAIIMVLAIQGCQINNTKHDAIKERTDIAKELIIKGQVSVPLPELYKKVLLDDNLMIITAAKFSVVYRWIDQNEIEFIGSNKSPYDFFESALNNPTSDEEKRFLEGLKDEVQRPSSVSALKLYHFDNGEGRQMYILSEALNFVVEVTYKGDDYHSYINNVVNNAKLQ